MAGLLVKTILSTETLSDVSSATPESMRRTKANRPIGFPKPKSSKMESVLFEVWLIFGTIAGSAQKSTLDSPDPSGVVPAAISLHPDGDVFLQLE